MKDEYTSAKYPGDLAYELLAPKRPILRIAGLSAIACGLAAAIVFWITYNPAVVQPKNSNPTVAVNATTQPQEDTSVVPVTNLAAAPEFPSDSSVVPTGDSTQSLDIGSMPSFPSMPSWDMNEDNTATTKTSTKSKESA